MPTSTEAIEKCLEVLRRDCDDPAEKLIREGRAMMGIGEAIKGMTLTEARATIGAAAHLVSITKPATQP